MTVKASIQRGLLPMLGARSFAAAARSAYDLCASTATTLYRRSPGVRSVLLRTSPSHRLFRPLVSDVDFIVTCDDEVFGQDDRALRRLRSTSRLLSSSFPIFGGAAFVPACRIGWEEELLLNVAVLGDAELRSGEVDLAELREAFAPDRSLIRASMAMWWYASRLHHWLFSAPQSATNWEKLFYKVACWAGAEVPSAYDLLATLDDVAGAGLGDLRARALANGALDDVFVAMLRALSGELARHDLITSTTEIADTLVVSLERHEVDAARVARERLRAALCRAAPIADVVVVRSAELQTYVVYCVFDDEALTGENLRRVREVWLALAPHVDGRRIAHPVIVDRTLLRASLRADTSQGEWARASGSPLSPPANAPLRRRALLLAAENCAPYLKITAPTLEGALGHAENALSSTLLQLTDDQLVFTPARRDALLAAYHPAYHAVHRELRGLGALGPTRSLESVVTTLAQRVREAAVDAAARWELPFDARLVALRAVA